MIDRLAFRNLLVRPWRSALLLLGYSLGVAVMIVLLSIGEAMLDQARNEKLVGGGDVTVLPDGIDIELLKTGGLGGMFFSIDRAHFIYRQLLAAPRLSPSVGAIAPQIEGKLVYVRTLNGAETPVLASGEIPSRTQAVGAMPSVAAGEWTDDGADREWRDPELSDLRHAIDHFHLPPTEVKGDPSWAEWHYFNVLSADHMKWAFISFIVAGEVPDGQWGGQVLMTLHEQGGMTRRFVANVPASRIRFSTSTADVAMGESSVTVLSDGRYAVRAHAVEEHGSKHADVNLVVTPAPEVYFPGAALTTAGAVSGYVVPGLRADASGSICVAGACEEYQSAQAYHDHNWGVWRGVTWDWGASRAGSYTLLYGRVHPDSARSPQPVFVYVTDSLGFLTLFRPDDIQYDDTRTLRVGNETIRIPSRGMMTDIRGADTLRVELVVEDATATDTRASGGSQGLNARDIARPYFIQMKGRMRVSGRVSRRPIRGEGAGFFETYR